MTTFCLNALLLVTYLDTSLCDVDVQTTHVKVLLKGKVLKA